MKYFVVRKLLMTKKSNEDSLCPFCGGAIARDALSCPHCGSDDRTGWSEQKYLDGIDLPGDDEYDDMLAREFPALVPRHKRGRRWPWWVLAGAGTLLALTAWALARSMLGLR